ncbi:2-C-methyl-D-erythritol 2,4-cyclodiphosphate synthase [candidate division WOR-3 bacterium]|uniref:2-C-methyl-D-erythritol 2,4-cyclodiphosphate synthase n=1 Tax=candidate division WOR-3 bacterium TaxID=2052148 RepID=A0A938BTV9_UNCW3|nr:2-C-methyl-D-erythritol 2,4-cyclodiphosphate synthase [candidate division WOR-3 bacterium]
MVAPGRSSGFVSSWLNTPVLGPSLGLTDGRSGLQSSHLNPRLSNRGRRNQPKYRIGFGFDAHELVSGRRLMLGGVHILSRLGLRGHSDADVLLHALTDALLGALALPDIGTLFPDTDARWRDAASELMLKEADRRARAAGYRLVNADCVLVCDQPKLQPYCLAVRESIAAMLGVPPDRIGLKAKTTEGMLLALKRKSIAAMAVVLVGAEQARMVGRPGSLRKRLRGL